MKYDRAVRRSLAGLPREFTLLALVGLCLVAVNGGAHAAALQVTCTSCSDPQGNRSGNLIFRKSTLAPVELSWSTAEDPAAGGRIVLLYAGNPAQQDAIPRHGELAFTPDGTSWKATASFQGPEVGQGTFLAIVTSRSREAKEEPDGANEQILDWRAFRLLTQEDQKRALAPPPPGSALSLTVTPALLSAKTGHGELPRRSGGDDQVWWSFVAMEGNTGPDFEKRLSSQGRS